MDYKIKFEYKGIGKQAAGIRQKVIQAQKNATGNQPGASLSGNKESITVLRTLNNSITKLIASNNNLARTMGGKSPGGGGGGVSGGGGGGTGGVGFGHVGASIPIIGAVIATLGIAAQKINQIGNAYIQKVSEQLSTAGIGGFSTKGAGIYTAGQMGAGKKAYGMATGKFLSQKTALNQTALNVGAIYGLSAEETMRTAGQFTRAGANYTNAANIGAGMGIQSELPMMLSGMADILTEAVKQGINTSDMSKDMAQDLASLVMRMPGHSVAGVLGMAQGFQGIGRNIARGKVSSPQALYATKAAQGMLMGTLTGAGGADYINNLEKNGAIDSEQAAKLKGLKKGASFSDLMQATPHAAFSLLRQYTAGITESNPVGYQQRTMEEALKSFTGGKGIASASVKQKQRFMDTALAMGFNETQPQMEAMLGMTGMNSTGTGAKGAKILAGKAGFVESGPVGMGIKQIRQREDLIFKYGQTFGEASLKMERAMINLADKAGDSVTVAINKLGEAATQTAGALDGMFKFMNKLQQKGALPMLFDYITH